MIRRCTTSSTLLSVFHDAIMGTSAQTVTTITQGENPHVRSPADRS